MMEKNIFVQILQAQKTINDNIITLSENLEDVANKIEEIEKSLTYDYTEPIALGEEESAGIKGEQLNNNQNVL